MEFKEADLNDLIHRAETFNNEQDITGFLHYSRGYFIQYIEGQEEKLTRLYNKIKEDGLHAVEIDLSTNQFEQPLFPTWRMRRLEDRFFIEIGLEDILQNQLIHGSTNKALLNRMEGSIWRIVEQISTSVRGNTTFSPS